MKPNWVTVDTRDDRREIWTLLSHLPPADRVRFLRHACSLVPQGSGRVPVPSVWAMRATLEQAYRCDTADRALTNEVYGDLLSLFNHFKLDATKTALLLEQWVRRGKDRA